MKMQRKECTTPEREVPRTMKKYANYQHPLISFNFKINRKALEKKMYISFIRPLLEYSDSVLDNCSNETKNNLTLFILKPAE